MKLQYFELDKPYVENQLTRKLELRTIDRIGKTFEERSYMNPNV